MADLDETAGQALEVVTDLLAAAERAQARFVQLRDQVTHAQARLDREWTSLRERTQLFLERAATEARQVETAKTAAHGALGSLRTGLDDLHGEVGRELTETQTSLETMGTDLLEIEGGMGSALDEADEAEEALRSRLSAVQTEVEEVVAETEGLLQGALVDELKETQRDIEQEAVELAATVSGEFVAAIEARSRELFEQLVETEAEIRTVLDQANEATEDAANRALRDCGSGVEQELTRLEGSGASLEKLLDALEDTVIDGRKRLEDRQSRWSDVVRRTREDLREAQDLLKEVEAALHRFGFLK